MKNINIKAGYVTAAEAFRRLGVKQGGPVRDQAKRVGLRLSGRHGALGGIYLVHEDEIARIMTKRAKQAAEQAAQQELALAESKVEVKPEPVVPDSSLREQMDRIEAKLDQLLAIWK